MMKKKGIKVCEYLVKCINPGFLSTIFKKSAWDLVYPGENPSRQKAF